MIKIECDYVIGANDDKVIKAKGATLRAAFESAKAKLPPGATLDIDSMTVDGEDVRGLCEDCGLPIADESFECDDDNVLRHFDCSDYDQATPPDEPPAMTTRATTGEKP